MCVKYIEKNANLTILTKLSSHIFFISHDSQHSTFFQKNFLLALTGPKLMILWPYKKSLKISKCLSVLKMNSWKMLIQAN